MYFIDKFSVVSLCKNYIILHRPSSKLATLALEETTKFDIEIAVAHTRIVMQDIESAYLQSNEARDSPPRHLRVVCLSRISRYEMKKHLPGLQNGGNSQTIQCSHVDCL